MSTPKPYGPILTNLSQVEINEDAWLWPGRIPLGALTTLVGFGGEGKSFLACSIASMVSRGIPFPDGHLAPQGAAIVMAGEDLPAKLRLRYEANNADLDKITLLEGQRIYTKQGVAETNITLRDIDLIREAVDQSPDARLLIVDPIGDFIPGINSDKDNEVRALLNPLAQLAKERQLSVLLICHRKKSAGDRADNVALGSVAFTSKARAVHHVILDPYDTAPYVTAPYDTSSANTAPTDTSPHPQRRRLFLPGKINDQEQAPGLAFRITAPNGVVVWETEPYTQSVDAIMHYTAAKSKEERSTNPHLVRDALTFLSEALQEGACPSRDLMKEAKAEGITPNSLRRAKEKLGVIATRRGFGGGSIWHFPNQLESRNSQDTPNQGAPPSQGSETTIHAPIRTHSRERTRMNEWNEWTNESEKPTPPRPLSPFP